MNSSDVFYTLQSMLFPEIGLSTERDVYLRLAGPAYLRQAMKEVHFGKDGVASFDTYANCFSIGKWHQHCSLSDLSLVLEGKGAFEVQVFLVVPDMSWDCLVSDVIDLENSVPVAHALRPPSDWPDTGVIHFTVRALEDGAVLKGAKWTTTDAPKRHPELMLSITTFRREKAVSRSVNRFIAFQKHSSIAKHLHLTVVDNGRSVELPEHDNLTVIPNANLGGSGGFARGLLEAKSRGASHCLFMDDDAAIQMEALERTWMFLAYATEENTAVAGAVANAQHRWMLWENGALFDFHCHSLGMGSDLRNPDTVRAIEAASNQPQSPKLYAGWWYFAFPIAHAELMPFPFFVRGDDISFSLANDFNILTLPGVICYQDEDFTTKQSPSTIYLDVRGHIAHHLVFPEMEIGRMGAIRIAAWFFASSFLKHHYETLAAINLSLGDMIEGPEFFRRNADMAQRRAVLRDLTNDETWRPLGERTAAPNRRWLSPDRFLTRSLMKLTLNGHLLPGFKFFGNRITLPAGDRALRRPIWGASEITYTTPDRRKSYTVTHNKKRALRESSTFLSLIWRIFRDYDEIRARWRKGYAENTTEDAWGALLNLSDIGSGKANSGSEL